MHELSIAMGIVDTAVLALAQEPEPCGAVRVIRVEVGVLSGVVPDALAFCFQEAAHGTRVSGASLEIVPVPLRLRCLACGQSGEAPDDDLRCFQCGGYDVEIVRGRELSVLSLDVETGLAGSDGSVTENHDV